ncbi:MAG: hypothetical protein JWP94_1668 [Mucilaginibacter sp.]|nr:hypothetical protein [Mucilaginibacter sp.]
MEKKIKSTKTKSADKEAGRIGRKKKLISWL